MAEDMCSVAARTAICIDCGAEHAADQSMQTAGGPTCTACFVHAEVRGVGNRSFALRALMGDDDRPDGIE